MLINSDFCELPCMLLYNSSRHIQLFLEILITVAA